MENHPIKLNNLKMLFLNNNHLIKHDMQQVFLILL